MEDEHLRSEKRILRISFVGSAIFLLAECIAAFFTHSKAILTDCVYDLVDLVMLWPFMILVPLLYKPETEKRPYGFSQVESLLIIVKCGLLLFLDIELMSSSIKLILAGGHVINAGAVAAFELCVSLSCITMFFILRHMNRRFSSPTIEAELYIWKLDSFSTFGVGIAFMVQLILQRTSLAWTAPYIDPAIAVIMALILLKEPVTMIIDAVKSLILFAPKREVMESIRQTTESVLGNYGLEIDFLDVVKTGRKLWIDIYIVQDDDLISVRKLKRAHDRIMRQLEPDYENVEIELIPEIDDIEIEEQE